MYAARKWTMAHNRGRWILGMHGQCLISMVVGTHASTRACMLLRPCLLCMHACMVGGWGWQCFLASLSQIHVDLQDTCVNRPPLCMFVLHVQSPSMYHGFWNHQGTPAWPTHISLIPLPSYTYTGTKKSPSPSTRTFLSKGGASELERAQRGHRRWGRAALWEEEERRSSGVAEGVRQKRI